MKNYSRKEFIKVSAATGAIFLLGACGFDSEKKENVFAPKDSLLDMGEDGSPEVKLDLVERNDPRYEALRKGFNKRIDKFPLVIALCTSTQEVAVAVKYAKENKLAIAVKSGGHSMEGFSCNDGGMVINLSKMNKVEFLDGNKIKVGPGCTLAGLYDTVLPEKRILPAGSCATVGLGGLTLGGGYGLFSRKYGLTCDHLLEATMVDGNGKIHSTKDNPELLWALKGGNNGNFGVVTEMVFKTQPAPPTMQAHYFKSKKLSAEQAAGILKVWMEIAPQLPETCFSGYVLNGSTLNIVITNYGDNTNELQILMKKMSEFTDEFHSSKVGRLARMLRNHYGSLKPVYFRNSSAGLFKGYKDVSAFITQIFEKVISNPGMIYQVNTLGGKIDDPVFEKNSAYPHRGFDFVSELQAYWYVPAGEKKLEDVTRDILRISAENRVTRQYVNYCSLEFSDWEIAYYNQNLARLRKIKEAFDPENNIRHPQSIKLA
ncbi:MAG: FAD-binding oxidoreductase [Bacteroidia bacterium]